MNFPTISKKILRLNSKILDLGVKIPRLSEKTLQWRSLTNEPKIAEMNNIIIRIYCVRIRDIVNQLNLLT